MFARALWLTHAASSCLPYSRGFLLLFTSSCCCLRVLAAIYEFFGSRKPPGLLARGCAPVDPRSSTPAICAFVYHQVGGAKRVSVLQLSQACGFCPLRMGPAAQDPRSWRPAICAFVCRERIDGCTPPPTAITAPDLPLFIGDCAVRQRRGVFRHAPSARVIQGGLG